MISGFVRLTAMLAAAPFLFAASSSSQPTSSATPAQFSTFLKANSSVQQVATDTAGYIYVLGTDASGQGSPEDAGYNPKVFVLRLDPAATNIIYAVSLGGSAYTAPEAMAVDPAGNVYVTGYTNAPDFPTVPAAAGPTGTNPQLPFVVKLDPTGKIVYSTLFSAGVRAIPQAIAVDSSGDAIVSGAVSSQGYPVTSGAYQNAWTINPPFISKLDPTGTKLLFSAVGVGGSALAFDSAGDIVIAGATGGSIAPTPEYPTTLGAYQTSYTPYSLPCLFVCIYSNFVGEQYVSKLSADGSSLLYSTFVTGSRGAGNEGLAIDASGNIWVTGLTSSPDYPYTSGAAGSGTFTTELDSALSKVLLSVPQGGMSLSIDPMGNLVEAGQFGTASGIQPPAGGIAVRCLPTGSGSYVVQMSSADGSVLAARIIPGGTNAGAMNSSVDSQGNVYIGGSSGLPDVAITPGTVYDASVTDARTPGAWLSRIDFSTPASPVACMIDATVQTLLGPVAPGQLISILGNGIGPAQPVNALDGSPSVPLTLGGVTVTFDGQAAPILYTASDQINVQVPFEISGHASTVMQVNYNGSSLTSRMFAIAADVPGLFVSSIASGLTCDGVQTSGQTWIATALNADGSVNSCGNPARAGSQITLLVNGTGVLLGREQTGVLTGSSPGGIGAAVALFRGGLSIETDSATAAPNSISGIGQIIARVPETIHSPQTMGITLTVDGVPGGPFAPAAGPGSNAPQTPVAVFVAP